VKKNIKEMSRKLTSTEILRKVILKEDPRKIVFIHDLMVFGMDVDDGWYDLIDTLCHGIQRYVDNHNDYIKTKWATAEEKKAGPISVKVDQIKEKYGGLRFYISGGDDALFSMIMMAEDMSYRICEVCGNRGGLSKRDGWYKTLCESCRNTKYKEYKLLK
jgi:hypothetical protein